VSSTHVLRIGFTHYDPRWGNFFWAIVGHYAKEEAEQLGVVLTRIYASSAQEQAVGLDGLLEQNMDALMICPVDSAAPELIEVVKKANAAGIPVIALDSKIEVGQIATTVGSDNVKGQEIAAEHIFKRLGGKGKVVYLAGDLRVQAGERRYQGFYSALERYPGIEVVFEADGHFRRDDGKKLTQEALVAHPDLQAVIAGNDHMAFGAIDAIAAAGRTGDILVTGFDGLPEALWAIQTGQMAASVGRDAREMVRQGIKLAINACKGLSVADTVLTDVELVTEANVYEKTIDSLQLLPNVLHNLSQGNEALRLVLETTAEVSHLTSNVLEPQALIQQAVDLIYTRCKLYYSRVQLYLLESTANRLTLVASAGTQEGGSQPRNISLKHPTSLVARAARSGKQALLIHGERSVETERDRDTAGPKAELAVPMAVAGNLIGVLHATSEETNRFNRDVLLMMTALGDQISVALHNARLYAEQVRLAEEMRALDQLKSRFLANMSHELRTPLNSILNFTEFVSSGVFGPINERQTGALTKVMNSGDHLLSLINDILDLTKIEAGMMELFVEEVDLNALMNDVLAMGQGLLLDKPVRLVTDIQENLPLIIGDRRRIRQILLNLISNAVKFTTEGSITVTLHVDDNKAQFSVQDTGPGIAPEDQSLIFEPFRQTKHGLLQNSGTGLGLPICKHLAQAHGGELWVESQVDVGSTFYVTIPLSSAEGRAQALVNIRQN
jgi:signal transduction histidine kinase/ABC-type sugar transport system substrate-binding protein